MIPKIIHQIWSGIDGPLPAAAQLLGNTWKRDYPEWEYRVWDNQMMNDFVQEHYPQYWTVYQQFPYNIQRWDAIRYLPLQYPAMGCHPVPDIGQDRWDVCGFRL